MLTMASINDLKKRFSTFSFSLLLKQPLSLQTTASVIKRVTRTVSNDISVLSGQLEEAYRT